MAIKKDRQVRNRRIRSLILSLSALSFLPLVTVMHTGAAVGDTTLVASRVEEAVAPAGALSDALAGNAAFLTADTDTPSATNATSVSPAATTSSESGTSRTASSTTHTRTSAS